MEVPVMARSKPRSASLISDKVRCAIYTRKSTEEGLEQEFNSLDAQYEACAAYILSQRHEGWAEIKERYDDGGFSGGSMERPALKRLMADMALGKVDVIVVYKVDRLTRSLADFAKIVEILDGRGASFVSVTQAFNTTTSMGRLTLNVLLSFAQFEREVTGERIRDKIAASKKKGMWMGGPVPLGYRVEDRSLVIDPDGSRTVRHIFERYLALGSGAALLEELQDEGYRTPIHVRSDGEGLRGGVPFSRGMLFHILGNPIYIGKVVHHDDVHDGQHEGIIGQELWDAVQTRIEANKVNQADRSRAAHFSPLAGLLIDSHGRRMSPSHAIKKGVRYRYYITHASERRSDGPAALRIPARDIEQAVIHRIIHMLQDGSAIRSLLPTTVSAQQLADALMASRSAAGKLDTSDGRRTILIRLIVTIQMADEQLVIRLDQQGLEHVLKHAVIDDPDRLILYTAATKMRAGKATKLVIGDAPTVNQGPDADLIQLMMEAQEARGAALANPTITIKDLARQREQCRHRLAKLVRLSWLSPRIVSLIMTGSQPPSITVPGLLAAELPASWAMQEAMLLTG
jgi:DNA invertase Pin-like site-specific DNA recombinase